jgi:hypothetical protein
MIDRKKFYDHVRQNPFGGTMTQRQVDGCNFILDQWEQRYPNGDMRWLAYCLATCKWETGHTMQPVEEWGHGAGHPYGVRDPKTGQIYDGRGDVQLTWEQNYEKMGVLLGLDLVNHPELALNPKIAADIMFIGMEQGLFTGVGLSRYFNDMEDPVNARRIINGTDHANDIANIYYAFKAGLL